MCRKPGNMPLDDFLRPSRVRGSDVSVPVRRGVERGHSVARHSARGRDPSCRPAAVGAKFVEFTTLFDPAPHARPAQRRPSPWPYIEGLRLDEAMHPLAFLATGMYGKTLPNQNGAPVRLVVPWKYGFKNIKAIVQDEVHRHDAANTTWMKAARERIRLLRQRESRPSTIRAGVRHGAALGDILRKPTLMFNGYADAGGVAVRRHGPASQLLSAADRDIGSGNSGPCQAARPEDRARAQARRLRDPAGAGSVAGLRTAHRPDRWRRGEDPRDQHRRAGAAQPRVHPRHHAAAAAHGLGLALDVATHARPVRVLLRDDAHDRLLRARPRTAVRRDLDQHREATVHHDRA